MILGCNPGELYLRPASTPGICATVYSWFHTPTDAGCTIWEEKPMSYMAKTLYTVDTAALWAAINQRCADYALTLQDVTVQAHVARSTLTRLGKPNSPGIHADSFASLVMWLGQPMENFVTKREGK